MKGTIEQWASDLHVQAERLLKDSDSYAKKLEAAETRVKELEAAIDDKLIIHHASTEGNPVDRINRLLDVACAWAIDPSISESANKFAIEQKIQVLTELLNRVCPVSGEVIPDKLSRSALQDEIEQLRAKLEEENQ